jgi:hypothetical protein
MSPNETYQIPSRQRESLDVDLENLKNKLIQRLVKQFQYDRCKGWHNTRNTGQLLKSFLRLIEDWASAGFPPEAFKDVSLLSQVSDGIEQSTSNNNQAAPNVKDLIIAFRDLLMYVGSRERNRLLGIDDFLLDFDVAVADPILVGGPETLDIFVSLIERLLDFWYLAVHGDYAFKIGEWLVNLDPKPFAFVLGDYDVKLLWSWINGEDFIKRIRFRQKRVKPWLDEKPIADLPEWPQPPPTVKKEEYIGCCVNKFVEDRLKLIYKLLGNSLGRDIWLNAAAYPRGGRKPPSVTHGTTYGVDLDTQINNVQSLGYLGKGAESLAREEMKKDVKGFLESLKQKNTTPGAWSLFATDDFLPAVMLTQAILLTFPSRMYYGDFIVISTALGGIVQRFNELNYQIPSLGNVHINYEPVAHHNHWHVDWLPDYILQKKAKVSEYALFKKEWQKSCSLEEWCKKQKENKRIPQECRKQRENIVIKERSQLQQPIFIAGPRIAALEYKEVEKILKEGLQFGTENFQLPLGDVGNEENIAKWLEEFLQSQKGEETWIH